MTKLISILGNSAGFYSGYFFLLNHYNYCKRHKIEFIMKSETWLYKSQRGWLDYFEPIELDTSETSLDNRNRQHPPGAQEKYDNFQTGITGRPEVPPSRNDKIKIFEQGHHIERQPIKEYQISIRETYKFNDRTKCRIEEIKSRLGLEPGKYDAIYIRRGDKLAAENVFRPATIYLFILLLKNPQCETVFLQTDDYICFLELQEYINSHNLKIRLLTTCLSSARGSITSEKYRNDLALTLHYKTQNHEYISKIATELTNSITISGMDHETIYEHTIDLLSSVDITTHSNICVTDYESNVGRFIKLAHICPERVFNILNHDSDIDYNVLECPAYHF